MKTIALTGVTRETLGTKDAKALRNEGKVPCVLYGGGEHSHFYVYAADFKNLVYTPNTYKVQLTLNDKKYLAILQDMQFHPISETIIHADFLAVAEDKPVIVSIPVKVVGNSPGVRAGGRLAQKITRLQVRGLINDIPDNIEVTIEGLEIGQSTKVKDIPASKVDILDAKENAVISIKMTRNVATAAAEDDKDKKKK
ncbi:MAG: 50S ribosomal protein L25/general stress protein Ctc [Cytophagales bacterium]|nr:50S ribosomal protein L25/general stress protein Ctc [Cytophaga sp.]